MSISILELIKAEHDTIFYWMYHKCKLGVPSMEYLGCAQTERNKWY